MQRHADAIDIPHEPDPVLGKISRPLGTSTLQVSLSPRRVGMMVRRNDVDQLRKALLAAASIWGGAGCPILPVNEDGTIDGGWLQIADTIGISEIADFTRSTNQVDSAWQGEKTTAWPITIAKELDDAEYWTPHQIWFHTDEQLRSLELLQPGVDSLIDLAGAGRIIDADRAAWTERGAQIIDTTDAVQIALAQIKDYGARSVLSTTRIHDTTYHGSGVSMMSLGLIWAVEDAPEALDLYWFWNLRALRPLMSDALNLVASEETLRDPAVIAAVHTALASSSATTPSCALLSTSLDTEQLNSLAEAMGMAKHEGSRMTEGIFGRRATDERPVSVTTSADPRRFWLGPRLSGVSSTTPIQLQRPETALQVAAPLTTNPPYIAAEPVILRLQSPAITGPTRKSVARLYLRQADGWDQNGVHIRTTARPTYSLRLGVPDGMQVLEAACRDSGVTFVPSDKGKQLGGVIDSAAKRTELFLRRSVIAVVRALTAPTRQNLQEMLERLEGDALDDDEVARLRSLMIRTLERTANEIRTTAGTAGTKLGAPEVHAALQDLIAHNLVYRGFRVDCNRCGLKAFRTIEAVTPTPSCDGCGSRSQYATSSNGEPAIYYQLNSLVNVTSQNGGLAPLVAAAHLIKNNGYVLPGANLKANDEPIGEVDILGWQKNKLFAGEAKMTAKWFTPDSIKADIKKSALLKADVHFTICLEKLPEEVEECIKEHCATEGLASEILIGDELFTG
jgi:hypothetical protein